jgi:integrase
MDGKTLSFLWDTVSPGLGLRAQLGGTKSYIFQAKLNGQVIRIKIGDPKTWALAAAQAEARRLKVIIDGGKDPRQVKADGIAAEQLARDTSTAKLAAEEQRQAIQSLKRELIARTAWEAYLKHPRPAGTKKSWGAQHRADHDIAASPGGESCKIGDKFSKPGPLAFLLAMPLHEITAQVIQTWLVRESAARPTFAHNSYRKFRTFIRWCVKQPEYQDATHADCCLADEVKDIVPANKTKEGDSLQREQLPAWFAAVRKISNPVISAYLQGLLITGARRGELSGLRWVDVDFQWRSLSIKDKVEGLRVIPLTPYLHNLLGGLPRRNEWVFSSQAAADGRLAEPRIAHTKALAAAGLPHVSLHGLRRSFGTLCEWVEVPSGISAQLMGHKPSALAEKHYRRRPLDLLRKWHDTIEVWMLAQAGIEFTPAAPDLKVITVA